MEGFYSYVDIFATKGIEYLLVIGFLLFLPLFWRVFAKAGVSREASQPSLSEWFHIPENYYYHQGHTWALMEGDVIKVGIDDFAQKLIGRLSGISLPRRGTNLVQGEEGLKVKVDGREIPLLSPVTGEVIEVNEEVLRSPSLINEDPYGAWLLKVKPSKKGQIRNLLTGALVGAWMENAVDRLRERIGTVYQDGGMVVSGIARAVDPGNWEKTVKEFLLVE